MKKPALAVVLLLVALGCGDVRLIRNASAVYDLENATFQQQCPVKSSCPDWEARRKVLEQKNAEINAAILAAKVGKLPSETRASLKCIAEPKKCPSSSSSSK